MAIGRPLNLTPNIATKNLSVIATAGQTLFAVTGGYLVNEIAVYRNGTRLVDGRDFNALDGGNIVLLSPATVGDVLEFSVFDAYTIANTIKPTGVTNQTIDGSFNITQDLVVGGTLDVTGAITGDISIGIQSAGTLIGAATTLNFIGSGNTFAQSGNIIDVSIAGGGGGGGLGTAINYSDNTASPFSYIDRQATVSENIVFDTTNSGISSSIIISVIPEITIASGIAMTVGAGKTMVIDALQIGDL